MGRRDLYPLADLALDGKLGDRLRTLRNEKVSFQEIAYDLRADGVTVSGETVRQWCIQLGIHREAS